MGKLLVLHTAVDSYAGLVTLYQNEKSRAQMDISYYGIMIKLHYINI